MKHLVLRTSLFAGCATGPDPAERKRKEAEASQRNLEKRQAETA